MFLERRAEISLHTFPSIPSSLCPLPPRASVLHSLGYVLLDLLSRVVATKTHVAVYVHLIKEIKFKILFPVLKSHVWLAAAVFDSADRGHVHHHRNVRDSAALEPSSPARGQIILCVGPSCGCRSVASSLASNHLMPQPLPFLFLQSSQPNIFLDVAKWPRGRFTPYLLRTAAVDFSPYCCFFFFN